MNHVQSSLFCSSSSSPIFSSTTSSFESFMLFSSISSYLASFLPPLNIIFPLLPPSPPASLRFLFPSSLFFTFIFLSFSSYFFHFFYLSLHLPSYITFSSSAFIPTYFLIFPKLSSCFPYCLLCFSSSHPYKRVCAPVRPLPYQFRQTAQNRDSSPENVVMY